MQTTNPSRSHPPYSTSPLLNQFDCIRHGFFGAQGGVSEGKYSSLNCGQSSHDAAERVIENRHQVAAQFGLLQANLYSLRQAHTTEVVHITPSTAAQFETVADGMVSADEGVALGVLGADCAPVLFVDPVKKVIGAAHSGWKGSLHGINEAVIKKMCSLGAERSNICASIGPAMQQAWYEVKEDFQIMFEQVSPINASPYFCMRGDKLYFDTPAYIYARLQKAGIQRLDQSKEDTFSQPDKYFSYRRSSQQGETDYGRQIAVIVLNSGPKP